MNRLILIFVFSCIYITTKAEKNPPIVATASMIADIAQNIIGDRYKVATIVPIGQDPHMYDPTPSDAIMVANAQVIFKNDLTFEGWLGKLIDNSGTKAQIITVTNGVEVIKSLKYQDSADPHAWMNAMNGIIYAENIKYAMIEFDSANKINYEKNFQQYKSRLEILDHYIQEEIKKIPEKQRILITSHDAFQYYGRKYGIRLESILGTSTEAQAQTSDIVHLDKVIKENQVPAVFIESTVNPKMLQQLAESNDILIGGALFSDSIGDKDSDAPTYIDMLRYNTNIIVKALSRKIETVLPTENNEGSNNNFLLYGLLGIILIGVLFFVVKKMG